MCRKGEAEGTGIGDGVGGVRHCAVRAWSPKATEDRGKRQGSHQVSLKWSGALTVLSGLPHCFGVRALWAPRPCLVDQETHFLFLKYPGSWA